MSIWLGLRDVNHRGNILLTLLNLPIASLFSPIPSLVLFTAFLKSSID